MVLKIQRPKLASYQKKILDSPARFTVTTAATKVGKTFSHLFWLFEKAHEAPKLGSNYWWVAPVYSQAKIAFRRLRRVAVQCGYRVNESELFIELTNGNRIWFKSAENPDNLYGEDVFAAVFDEFTRAKESAWIALRSTLTATRGQCKFIGNAKGRKNWGYKLALKAKNGEPGYEYHKITAYDAAAEGLISLEEIEQAKRDLPDLAFRELYLAEDLEDQANPFGIDFIKKQVKPISSEYPVCFGVDLAKSVDWTVVTGLDYYGDVCHFERWQSDWGQTKARILSIVGFTPTLVDSTGVGDPIVEDLAKVSGSIEGYHFSGPSKQKLMEGLASALQNNEISVLEGTMKDELEAFEYVYSARGVKYSAPEGIHDDTVVSLALAREKFKNRALGYMHVSANR